MIFRGFRSFSVMSVICLSSMASAENHIEQPSPFGVLYGNDDCNNDADFLTENNIICAAVFSNTTVWDFLNNLQRRIALETLVELNPSLGTLEFETVLTGITFVRVQ